MMRYVAPPPQCPLGIICGEVERQSPARRSTLGRLCPPRDMEETMKKLMVALTAAAAIGSMVLVPTEASAQRFGGFRGGPGFVGFRGGPGFAGGWGWRRGWGWGPGLAIGAGALGFGLGVAAASAYPYYGYPYYSGYGYPGYVAWGYPVETAPVVYTAPVTTTRV